MPSFGESMKRERELRQITLREISEATKINLRYLDALERNDFRHLPGGVFNKGFVRAFAQYIGIDPESMVTAYLQEEQSQQARVEERRREALRRSAGNEPAGKDGEALISPDEAGERSRALRIVGAAAILAILVAIVLLVVFLPPRSPAKGSPPPGAAATPPPPAVSPGGAAEPETGLEARVIVVRKTPGSLNCDDRERRDLGEMLPGAELVLRCGSFLVVDAEDGGAIRLGIGGAFPETLGPDGQPVRGHRIDAAPAKPAAGGKS
jgi:hypothetical protein